MANTLLSGSLIASRTGSSSNTSLELKTAQWAIDNYGVGSRYTGNTIVADPLCYGVYIYFDSAYTNNGSSGVSDFKCYMYKASQITKLYWHMFHIIVPQGYGLPTSSNLATNANALFGIDVSSWSSVSLRFTITLVSGTTKTTDFLNISSKSWIKTGGRMYITINSSTGVVYAPSYFSPSTAYINGAKELMKDGIITSDIDCMDQTHVLRT